MASRYPLRETRPSLTQFQRIHGRAPSSDSIAHLPPADGMLSDDDDLASDDENSDERLDTISEDSTSDEDSSDSETEPVLLQNYGCRWRRGCELFL